MKGCNFIRHACRLGVIVVCGMPLAACENRVPPSAPSRPQTMAESYRIEMRKAVFRYDMPCIQTVHPVAPNPARNCEWESKGGMNHDQVVLSN